MRGLACHSRRGRVDLAGGDGIESAARDARYRAFNELAAKAGVQHILLAQHSNDQAETVLLRLMRGAGPTGLAAMAPIKQRGRLTYLRPWPEIDPKNIMEQAKAFSAICGGDPVSDHTNAAETNKREAVCDSLA